MAKKPTINTIGSGYASKALLNTNFTALRDGFDNTLSLDGSTPNAMGADLDMNSNTITNVSALYADAIILGGVAYSFGDNATSLVLTDLALLGDTTAEGLQVGDLGGLNIDFDGVGIQGYNAGVETSLSLNAGGGAIVLGSSGSDLFFNGDTVSMPNATITSPTMVLGDETIVPGSAKFAVWSDTDDANIAVFRSSDVGTERGLYITANNATGDVNLSATGAAAGNLVLKSNVTEGLRINTAGNVIFGVKGRFPDGSAGAPSICFDDYTNMGFYRTGTTSFAVALSGTEEARFQAGLTNSASTTVQTREKADARYAAISLAKYKDAQQELYDGSVLDHLIPKTWVWNDELGEGDERIGRDGMGFIVEDVIGVIPEAIRYQSNDEGEQKPLGLDPMAIIAILTKELQDLKTRVAVLEGNA